MLQLACSNCWAQVYEGRAAGDSQPLSASFTCRGNMARQKDCDFRSMQCCFSRSWQTFQYTGSRPFVSIVNCHLQLRSNLERAMAEKGSELEQVQRDLDAAQAEATLQEELADLAKGELDEFKRHMAAEVEHARQEAIKMMRAEHGGPPYSTSL